MLKSASSDKIQKCSSLLFRNIKDMSREKMAVKTNIQYHRDGSGCQPMTRLRSNVLWCHPILRPIELKILNK